MDSASARERLYEVFVEATRDDEDPVTRALEIGVDYLDLPIGFFTRIDEGTQEIVRATGDHDRIRPGETCPLDRAYCRETIEREGTLAVQHASESPIDERAIEAFDLGTYIGSKVVVDGEVYGTVCFADHDERNAAFSETEELFLELLANLVGGFVERREYERSLQTRADHLEREKRRFEGIAENSFDIIFRVGPDGRFTYVSSAVERVLGYDPEALTDRPFIEFIAAADVESATAAYARVCEGERVERLELTFLDRTGERVIIEINATPIFDGPDVVGIQGVGRDITTRKARTRELRTKTRAMDEADVGITIADPSRSDLPIVYANEGFERITGYDAESIQGRNCRFLQGEATDGEKIERLAEAIEVEEPVQVELVNYRRDGTPFWNQVQLSPVFDEAGDLSHYLGIQKDVTARKRTATLIRLLNRVLRHNLRNDTTALAGWADVVRRGDAEEVAEAGRRIERISRGLMSVSEHARDLERHASRERDPARLDPATLLSRVAAAAREDHPRARIDVAVETDRGICAGAELRQALAELIENAIKHNPAERPAATVSIRDDGAWIEVVVADDGPGIDEMEAAVVSTGNETALQHSAGLGLWLINWIVTRYGGSFQIEATEGEKVRSDGEAAGTTATVRLPAIDDDASVEDAERGPTVLFR
ncbi:PAS domain S-box protein [Halobellus rubicundus]|uniref:PAS domain S-box protein n=1 Tax=Halobellus rubicundus TaxID=2996466 RepID=A0ABD5MEH3_9EURY